MRSNGELTRIGIFVSDRGRYNLVAFGLELSKAGFAHSRPEDVQCKLNLDLYLGNYAHRRQERRAFLFQFYFSLTAQNLPK